MYTTLRIERREWVPLTLSFIYHFALLAAYYVMRPVRDQLAAEVGSDKLLGFFAITFIATLILTPLFAALVSNWPRRWVIPLVYLVFIGCQLAFMVALATLTPQIVGTLFFIWVSVFNLFALSVFWSLMVDIWSDSQALRLFPLIAFGGALGAVLGPILTSTLVMVIGPQKLLLVSAAFLVLAIACTLLLERWEGVSQKKVSGEALGGSMWDGLKQVFSDPFIASMALMMVLNDAIGTIAYVLVTDYSGTAFRHDAIAQTRFAANIDFATNLLQILIQLTLTRWLLAHYGAKGAFALTAVCVVLGSLAMAFLTNPFLPLIGPFPAVALIRILTRSLGYGLVQPARETLYTLVPRTLRYKGKNAVDTAVWRAGDVLSLLLVQGLKTIGVAVSGFALLWAFLAALSGSIGFRLASKYERL